MLHIIDYTKLKKYKELIRIAPETTGPIQKKRGVLRFKNKYDYVIYQDGRVNKVTFNGGSLIIKINEISKRTKDDYNKAFQAIIDKINGVRRKSVPWYEQFKIVRHKVLHLIFENDYISETLIKILKNDYTFKPYAYWSDRKKDNFRNYSFEKKVYTLLKETGYIKKGVDYE